MTLEENNSNTSIPQEPGDKINSSAFSFFIPNKEYFFTPIIINLNILHFLLMCFIGGANLFEPDSQTLVMWGANFAPYTENGEWWRLVTCTFEHIGLFHLLFNMYAFVYVGIYLEPLLGKIRFGVAYLVTGSIASYASLAWYTDPVVSAGASGAIFGMYGIFLALLTTKLIDKDTRKSLLTSIIVFVGYNLLSGLRGGVDNAAHIGGLVSGFIIGYILYYQIKNKNT